MCHSIRYVYWSKFERCIIKVLSKLSAIYSFEVDQGRRFHCHCICCRQASRLELTSQDRRSKTDHELFCRIGSYRELELQATSMHAFSMLSFLRGTYLAMQECGETNGKIAKGRVLAQAVFREDGVNPLELSKWVSFSAREAIPNIEVPSTYISFSHTLSVES